MISITASGIKETRSMLGKAASQVPFAMALALTKTAQDAQGSIRKEMRSVFDRPTPYTLNALYIKPATKERLQAEVGWKDAGDRDYLAPEVYSGFRSSKAFENRLRSAGILPAGLYVVPGAEAELNRYGNMKASQIIQLLAYFQAFGEKGYRSDMNAKNRLRFEKRLGRKVQEAKVRFTAIKKPTSTGLIPGIYKQTFSADGTYFTNPIMIFVRQPAYRVRLRFHEVANKRAQEVSQRNFKTALQFALRTAK